MYPEHQSEDPYELTMKEYMSDLIDRKQAALRLKFLGFTEDQIRSELGPEGETGEV